MTLASAGALLALLASLGAALAYGVLAWRDGPLRVAAGARLVAVSALALSAALAGEGWLLPLSLVLLALAAGVALPAHDARRTVVAAGLLLLALAGEASLAIRSGGGVGILRAEPLRLAGLVADVSLAVLALRRGPLRPTPQRPEGLVVIGAVFLAASAAVALPLARGAAMAGGVAMLFALTPLGRSDPASSPWGRGRSSVPAALAFYCGQALFAVAFMAPARRLLGAP